MLKALTGINMDSKQRDNVIDELFKIKWSKRESLK